MEEKRYCVLYKEELAEAELTYGSPDNIQKGDFSMKAMKELWGSAKPLVNSGAWMWKIKPIKQ